MREIDSLQVFEAWLTEQPPKPAAFQSLDLRPYEARLLDVDLAGCVFLGCKMSRATAGAIVEQHGFVIPYDDSHRFSLHRSRLYSVEELFAGFDLADPKGYHSTYDYQVYEEYLAQGKHQPPSIFTSLLRRLHDHSITDAIEELIAGRKVVAVMGGHGMERRDPFYLRVARIARELTRRGFLMASGGGPGAMEATHLGAWFVTRSEDELAAAVDKMKARPTDAVPGKEYADPDWLHRAWRVREAYPLDPTTAEASISLGIPTWLYGHEPPAVFATHIGKYFANSVREDGLLAIAKHGVIFAPGSAGTTQEIFQDATQNHYGSMGYISPMILFGRKHWTETRPLWDFLQKAAEGKRFGELLALTDNEPEIVERISGYDPEFYTV